MTESGGIKAVISSSANLTLGEDRPLKWTVKDANGDAVSSFSGWEFGFYMARTQRAARPEYASDCLIVKTDSDGISSSVPDVTASIDPDDTDPREGFNAGTYFYGLFRTDTDDKVRLAYGPITFID